MSGPSDIPPPLRVADDGWSLEVLDQTRLPFTVDVRRLATFEQVLEAITAMRVRGAPLIGITAAYGLALALLVDDADGALDVAAAALLATRPTAINLAAAVTRVADAVRPLPRGRRTERAYAEAAAIADAERAACRAIAGHGLGVLKAVRDRVRAGRPVQVLTHCNAGWLATLEYGTALAPIYRAWEEGIELRVWVDETRPRGQGWLTAWELGATGVPHTVIADTAAGHLMQRGEVDLVLVGTDRVTRRGDVCNKIGTYQVALAARASKVPFYVAGPSSSIDWSVTDAATIPIELRDPGELASLRGCPIGPEGVPVHNPAFDVTPARLVSGLITERGVCRATESGLLRLFPERRP